MNNRERRKLIAQDTLKILKQGFYQTPAGERIDIGSKQKYAETGTKLYSPKLSDELLEQRIAQPNSIETKFLVKHATTLDAVRGMIEEGKTNVACLNFASAKNPGGGFLGGSQAQEESIARSTGLHNCQMIGWEYYEVNRNTKSCIYTDYMIYSPNVPILKNEEGVNLNRLNLVSIITAPAVNFGVVENREPEKVPQVKGIMKRRIAKVLAIALEHGHQHIVLGAWGCGVFQNDPNDVARWFKDVIEEQFKNEFLEIVFAVFSKNEKFIRAFQNEF